DMIAHAKKSISLSIFYASSSKGDKVEPIIAAIGEAAKRRVDVRLLFDATFYEKNKDVENAIAALPNVHVRLIDIKAKTNGVMHAKYFVVDDEDAYIGSANFDGRALDHIQEIGVRVKSKEIATALDQVFRTDWREAEDLDPKAQRRLAAATTTDPPPQPPTSPGYGPKPLALPLPKLPVTIPHGGENETVMPVVSPRKLMPEGYASLDELPKLEAAIDGAKTSIDIQLLTYNVNTDDVAHKFTALDDAIRRAAARGVTVRLLVSDWNLDDDKIESLRELVRNSKVQVEVLTIPQFSQGFIPYARVSHAKYMVVDGQTSWVGSSNWEESYFTRTRNVGLVIEGKKFAGELDTVFEDGWSGKYAKAFDANATYATRKRN
ncbi:MAG TPA: phospholipase D-like domain-containing protein, partial [Polyangiaceae bacterium]